MLGHRGKSSGWLLVFAHRILKAVTVMVKVWLRTSQQAQLASSRVPCYLQRRTQLLHSVTTYLWWSGLGQNVISEVRRARERASMLVGQPFWRD